MAGLEDEEVVSIGGEKEGDFAAQGAGPGAVCDLSPEVGLPAAEIIIHIDDGDGGGFGAAAQGGEAFRGGEGVTQQTPASGKAQVVDDVDEKEGGAPGGDGMAGGGRGGFHAEWWKMRGNSTAGGGVRGGDGLGLGGAFLAQPDGENDEGEDGEEFALPVLERLEPELG